MYQNSDRELIKEIAEDNYKNHRARNFTAIFAIFLTALLITTVCTVGVGFFSTARNAGEQAPGPMADGYLIGGEEQQKKALERSNVDFADLVRVCSSAPLHNREFGGVNTRLYAPDPSFYRNNLVELITGTWPEKENEIIISDTLAENLGLPAEAGQPFLLETVVLENGEEREAQLALTICGIYKNPLFSISSIYEEIYTSKSFREVYNPELSQNEDIIYVRFNDKNPLLFHTDIDTKLAELQEATGAKTYSSGKNSANFFQTLFAMTPVLFLVLLLMASGYFLIYNVFYISVASDIRWFGMMRTIGGTKLQIRRIMDRQVRRMTFFGAVGGIAAGYVVGVAAAGRVMDMTDWAVYYKKPAFLPAALVSLAFAVITVKISVSRPVKTASGISPVEAARFTPKKKKGALAVISLALSGVIFLAVSNAVLGYRMEEFVDRYNQEDYQIFHKSSLWTIEESYQPISQELAADLKALPFVEQVDTVYMARTDNRKMEYGYYEDSTGEIAAQGKLWEYLRSAADEEDMKGYRGNGIPGINERGNLTVPIFGMPPARWESEQVNYRIVEGEYDREKFASGRYVIYNKKTADWYASFFGGEPDREKEIHAGDALSISFYDSDAKVYRPRELTVLMVIEWAHEYTSSDIAPAVFVLPDTLFREIYSGYAHMTGSLEVRAKEELNEDQVEQIKALIHREHNAQLQTSSRFDSWQEADKRRITYGLLGFFLSGILAVIGISNVVNTITADVFASKLEYAVMQSVGMTKRQLFTLLFFKALKLCTVALLLIVPGGAALGSIFAGSALFTGFNAPLFAGMACMLTAAIAALAALLCAVLTKELNRRTLVERMRETE